MKIEKGQIWERIPPEDNKSFPKKGWKIEIIGVIETSIVHKMVEYDGKPRNGSESVMAEGTLLYAYKLVS